MYTNNNNTRSKHRRIEPNKINKVKNAKVKL